MIPEGNPIGGVCAIDDVTKFVARCALRAPGAVSKQFSASVTRTQHIDYARMIKMSGQARNDAMEDLESGERKFTSARMAKNNHRSSLIPKPPTSASTFVPGVPISSAKAWATTTP